ncbi:hypothetical protein GRI75_00310 [Altererythrobacter soli]|uniref:Lipoprotein n=1 Tax=Croceibacterium soli TaxID=1739690 RepID=A0A6I4USE0_9SPHN|nr:hypothetical protein [Croceibacterium soli]MXP40085.1 hypothetical protein [Croceibacterium soli]
MNLHTRPRPSMWLRALALPVALSACATPGEAQVAAPAAAVQPLTYADLAGLAEPAAIIARVTVKDQANVPPERAPGLAPGHARLYVEAQTERVLKGPAALGESLRYLVDLPLDAKGKPPKLKKQSLLVFANPVPGRPSELQLIEPDAQLSVDEATEARLRGVIAELVAPGAPPRVTGVRDVLSVAGNLSGESETQMFVDTVSGNPVALTVVRRPGMDPQWGVSWTEIVDQAAQAPAPGTLEWYRLACSLPPALPASAYLQADAAGRSRAETDYRFVLEQLGPCERTRD